MKLLNHQFPFFREKLATLNFQFSTRRGFTLIELLVVISIIGILASLGTMSYSTVQAKARDSQRKNDIVTLKKAILIYYTDFNVYPPTSGPATNLASFLTPKYIKAIPTDPKNDPNNYYQRYNYDIYTCGGIQVFRVWAWLENNNDPQGTGGCGEQNQKYIEAGHLVFLQTPD